MLAATVCLLALLPGCNETTGPGPFGAERLWRYGNSTGSTSVPYADARLAVFNTLGNTRVVALRPGDGTLLWETPLSIPSDKRLFGPPSSTLVSSSGFIIVPAWDLFGLDEQTGAVRWTFSPDDDYPGADATVGDDGSLYSVGRYVYRIQPTTGQAIWRVDLQERPFSPVVAAGVVYVGTRAAISGSNVLGAGHAVALDAATGRVLWKTPIPAPEDPARGGVNGPGALTADMFIVASDNGRVYGLDRATGAQRWEFEGDRSYLAGVVMLGNVAVVASAYGKIQGINAQTGAALWTVDAGGHFIYRITTDGELAYAVNGRLFALNARGQIVWRYDAGESVPIYTGPRSAGGTVFVGANDGFHAVRPRR